MRQRVAIQKKNTTYFVFTPSPIWSPDLEAGEGVGHLLAVASVRQLRPLHLEERPHLGHRRALLVAVAHALQLRAIRRKPRAEGLVLVGRARPELAEVAAADQTGTGFKCFVQGWVGVVAW